MKLQELFKLLSQDKANHEVYGARVGSIAAFIAIIVCRSVGAARLSAPTGAVASIVASAAVGWAKEKLDERANKAAIAAGELPPHEVSRADIIATAKGGLFVAAPLIAASLI